MKKGFTMIETVIVIGLTALISVVLGGLLSYFYRTNVYTLEQSTSVGQARRGVEDAMRFLREASYGSDGSYPVASVSTSSMTFYANVDASSDVERVTYSLVKGTFYRAVAKPSGNPLSYAGAAVSTSTIAVSVVNASSTPVFRYFDDTSTELPPPVNISKIASVRTTLIIDVNVNRAPVAFTLSSGATLRNLKDPL